MAYIFVTYGGRSVGSMRATVKLALLILLLGMLTQASAMRFLVQENRLLATGTVAADDAGQLQTLLAAHKTVGELVLINVSGPGTEVALTAAKLVAEKRLKTTIVGYCMAACAPIFLGGTDRRFAMGEHPRRTFIAIQGAYQSKSGVLNAEANRQWDAFLKEKLGEKYDAKILGQALNGAMDSGGFLRIREVGRTTTQERRPFFCPSGQSQLQDCTTYADKDALSLGVVTDGTIGNVALPGSFLSAPEFFGRPMTDPTPEFVKVLTDQGLAMCGANSVCVQRWEAAVPVYIRQKANRGAALGVGKPGLAFSDDQETLDLAAKRAIFLCNHVVGNKKLCRMAAVNDMDLASQYSESYLQTKDAPALIKVPESADVEEDADAGVAAPTGYRLRDLQAPTPMTVPGVKTWKTRELAATVKNAAAVLVDVAGPAETMLPAATHFWDGGLAFADLSIDSAYDQRFRDMLDIVAPAKDRPLVFYCRDTGCWTAINAAMRAAKAGYVQVGWYRGGVTAWAKAGLPLVRKVPLAVIN